MRKKMCPNTSIQSRNRFGSMLFTMSMRMCSFDSSVQPAQRRNTAPNRIHWISSHAFDEVLKTLRTVALAALTRIAARMPHATTWPRRVLTVSTTRLNRRSAFIFPPYRGWLGRLRLTAKRHIGPNSGDRRPTGSAPLDERIHRRQGAERTRSDCPSRGYESHKCGRTAIFLPTAHVEQKVHW